MRGDNEGIFRAKEKEKMLIIVGLGNPGTEYAETYHNLGFMAVDALCAKLGTKCKRLDCSSLTAVLSKNGEKIVLAKPVTYMNLSGQAVKSLAAKHKALIEDIIVIYDDIDIPRFSVRARTGGSGGTHNGMKNIISVMGGDNLKRIRIGAGREEGDLRDYVLSNILPEDKKQFDAVFEKTAAAIKVFMENKDFDALMRELNTKQI